MLIRNPRFRKVADRLLIIVPIALACFNTYLSLPDPGKSWRPLLVAQIVVAWLAVAIGIWTWRRGKRKQTPQPLPETL